ncbi:MAG: hypothetical protein AAGC90_00965 [Curtobacterium sp.]
MERLFADMQLLAQYLEAGKTSDEYDLEIVGGLSEPRDGELTQA